MCAWHRTCRDNPKFIYSIKYRRIRIHPREREMKKVIRPRISETIVTSSRYQLSLVINLFTHLITIDWSLACLRV